MTGDEATLDFYDREAAVYAPWSAQAKFPYLEKFLTLVPGGAPLLDYGCGGGWAAKRMLEAGHEVEAFDGSPGLAAEARQLTGLDVKVMRFAEFDAPGRYAGIWASFCLLHAPREDMADNLARIFAALTPGGRLYLGLKGGAGEKRDSIGRFYVYFEIGEIEGLLHAAGFDSIETRSKPTKGYDGEPEIGLHILARRP